MKKQTRKYLMVLVAVVLLFVLSACNKSGAEAKEPIQGWTGILDILVWPMAATMYYIGKVFGNNYGIAIVLTTLLVRTFAWPIYAKTNDLSLKMQLMGPEQAKLEQKYAGKTDQESMQRKQMETMQLYKKHGVGFLGCLLPLVQFPLFIAFYETLQRIPLTIGEQFKFNFGEFSNMFLGLDLLKGRTEPGSFQAWGVIVLAGIVGITQVLSQYLMQKRQKKAKAETQSDVPAYRQPQQTDMQKQTETTMKFMMYGMSIMMVFFVYNSTAALGLYWLVGNLYTTLQGYIGHKRSKKRMETLKAKM